MKCIFIKEWECPIENSEIPLEVCKVCLEARKIKSKHIKITREIKSVEMLPPHKVETEIEIPQIVTE
jgi:hypothetical protein